MNTSLPALLQRVISSRRGRCTICVAVACVAAMVSARPAHAQAVYTYIGKPFTIFSCSEIAVPNYGGCPIPAGPTNPYTTYTGADFVSATLTLDAPLPPDLVNADVSTLPGFQLVMSDGQHTITFEEAETFGAIVDTDASGRIIRSNLGFIDFDYEIGLYHSIDSFFGPFGSADIAISSFDQTDFSLDFGESPVAGAWTSSTLGPGDIVKDLIRMLSNPDLGLKAGLISSLTDKLNNVLASIDAGANSTAIKQLEAFINEVQSAQRTGKISFETGSTFIATAREIIEMLRS